MQVIRVTTQVLTLVAGLVSFAGAQSSQVCFTDQIQLTTTDWVGQILIPKFDPNLGDLVSLTISLTGNVQGTARIESLDNSEAQAQTQFSSRIAVSAAELTALVVSVPLASFTDDFAPFDGTVDYAGPSGTTHLGIDASDAQSTNLDPSSADLALFIGTGNFAFPVAAQGLSAATGSGNLMTQFMTAASASVTVCYNYTPNVPPTLNCPGTLMASAAVPLSFQICASDPDLADTVMLTSSALPSGMTATPALPMSGNPVCTTIHWTPASNQVGTTTITFTAIDSHLRSTSCTLSITVAECHVLFSTGTGSATTTIFGHVYDTQLAGVRRHYPVTLTDIPSFAWNQLPPAIFVQVVMYNPQVFPSNPSQWSSALMVVKNSNGTVTNQYFGSMNGIGIRADVYTVDGALRVRFPFHIQGIDGW